MIVCKSLFDGPLLVGLEGSRKARNLVFWRQQVMIINKK